MVIDMKASYLMGYPTDLEPCATITVMFVKVRGSMAIVTVMELTLTQTVVSMSESGEIARSTGARSILGLMAKFTKAITATIKRTAWES